MIHLLFLSMRVRFTVTANRVIHFLRQLPLIKKAVPASLYGVYDLKTVFTVLGVLSIASRKLISRLLYAACVTGLGLIVYQIAKIGGFRVFMNRLSEDNPFVAITARELVPYILLTWFILSFVGGFVNARIISTSHHKMDSVMINYMRSDSMLYAKSHILFDRVVDLILYLPHVFIAFIVGGLPVWQAPVMLIVFTAFRLLGEVLNLFMYHRIGKHFGNLLFSWVSVLIFLAALWFPAEIGVPNFAALLQNPFVIIGSIAAGIAAYLYIVRYPLYSRLLRERIAATELLFESSKKRNRNYTVTRSVKNWSKNLSAEDLQSDRHKNKTGFAYLNAIFFDRHRSFFRKKIFIRAGIILLSGIGATLVSIITMLRTGAPLIGVFENLDIVTLFNYAPIFFFVIYITSMGRVVTASVFSNCDIHMLHYPYYRTKETAFASFKARFRFILRGNLIITTLMSVSALVAVMAFTGQFDSLRSVVFFLLLTCIGVFFAFNDLFLYYVIQPYDSAGQAKSMIYSVINGIVYVVAYTNLQISLDFYIYSIILPMITVLYLGVGMLLLLRFAPRNFKLR